MDKKKEVQDLILRQGVLPLYFNKSEEVSKKILKTLYEAGIRAVEYTFRGREAKENFAALKELCTSEMGDMRLGVGTVKNKKDSRTLIDLEADFIVSPGFVKEIAHTVAEHDILWIPGCMPPSEIIEAENYGTQLIKLFPGSLLTPQFVRTIKPLFPHLFFMPTGGVDIIQESLEAWFDSGVDAVGIGSKLIQKEAVSRESYSAITLRTRQTLEKIQKIRNPKK